jgi:hypothetical protein
MFEMVELYGIGMGGFGNGLAGAGTRLPVTGDSPRLPATAFPVERWKNDLGWISAQISPLTRFEQRSTNGLGARAQLDWWRVHNWIGGACTNGIGSRIIL